MAVSQEQAVLYGGAAALVLGVVLIARRGTQLTYTGGGGGTGSSKGAIDLAGIFEGGITNRLRIESDERIAIAKLAETERVRGKELDTQAKIEQIRADTAQAIADTIAGTKKAGGQAKAGCSTYIRVLGCCDPGDGGCVGFPPIPPFVTCNSCR